jgi:predicted  nucleic acid-binding Zn-ribbon protein
MVEGLLAALTMEVSALRHDDQALRHQLASVYDELQHARLEIQDARRAMDRELVIDANVKVLGKIGGTVRPA